MFKVLLITGLLAFSSSVQALNICDGGSWYDPISDGQGLSVEISNTIHRDKPNVIVYYYTYDKFGLPWWTIGVGNQTGGNAVNLEFAFWHGMVAPIFDPEDRRQEYGGTGTFTRKSSKTATFTFRPSEEMKIVGHINQTFYLEKLFDICE